MKVLVIGSGGREHALAWRLSRCSSVEQVFAGPGNPGVANVATRIAAADVDSWLAFAAGNGIDLTVVGPEVPLVAGVADRFRAEGLTILGPSARAAQIEGSKAFAKDVMIRAGVPTARHRTATAADEAWKAIDEFGYPAVLKADGLAAGKGVVIAADREAAAAALPEMLTGSRLVVEEFLTGEEVSFIVLTDGKRALPFAPTQDHKAAFDGDIGPNTGGMGAYRDDAILTGAQSDEILRTIIDPTLAQMAADGSPFTGFLYAGLMMTAHGPRVIEFNARLGDPETQPLMYGLRSDLAETLLSAAKGDLSGASPFEWEEGCSVCVVLAAHGYPGKVRTGDVINGIEAAERTGATVFHAGTTLNGDRLVTSGGRVLGVTSAGADLRTAIDRAYAAAREIHFDGMHLRTDIGAKGLRRNSG